MDWYSVHVIHIFNPNQKMKDTPIIFIIIFIFWLKWRIEGIDNIF